MKSIKIDEEALDYKADTFFPLVRYLTSIGRHERELPWLIKYIFQDERRLYIECSSQKDVEPKLIPIGEHEFRLIKKFEEENPLNKMDLHIPAHLPQPSFQLEINNRGKRFYVPQKNHLSKIKIHKDDAEHLRSIFEAEFKRDVILFRWLETENFELAEFNGKERKIGPGHSQVIQYLLKCKDFTAREREVFADYRFSKSADSTRTPTIRSEFNGSPLLGWAIIFVGKGVVKFNVKVAD